MSDLIVCDFIEYIFTADKMFGAGSLESLGKDVLTDVDSQQHKEVFWLTYDD